MCTRSDSDVSLSAVVNAATLEVHVYDVAVVEHRKLTCS